MAEESPPGHNSAPQERRHTTLRPARTEAESGNFPTGEPEWL